MPDYVNLRCGQGDTEAGTPGCRCGRARRRLDPGDGWRGVPADATLEHAIYWRQIYFEILAMEEKVLARIRQLMATQSDEGRREVELTNLPVVVAQAES